MFDVCREGFSVRVDGVFRQRWVFLKYTKCSLFYKDDFVESFVGMLGRNEVSHSKFYGCRVHRDDATVDYYVLLNLKPQVCWEASKVVERFSLLGSHCESLEIRVPERRQSVVRFVGQHSMFCSREPGSDFGVRADSSLMGHRVVPMLH